MIDATGDEAHDVTVAAGEAARTDVITIPDAGLLLSGTFHRAGTDLRLDGHDGQHLVIPGYFASAYPAALAAPSGERLTAEAIALRAGRHTEVQPTNSADNAHHAGPDVIGHVGKITGDVTVEHDGVTVTLHAGDAIYRNDVVKTGGASSVSIALTDGTALNLVANARMLLNDYSFDANSTA